MTHSQWFAPADFENQTNIYFRAKATFDITTIPQQLPIRLCAESRYRLWCNGREVGTGPARGNRTTAFYDTFDLASFLQQGTNQLEVLVSCANIPTFTAAPLRPALWVELEKPPLQWRVARDTNFDSQSAMFNFQTGFCEWRDLRDAQLNWQKPQYFSLAKVLLPRNCAPLKVQRHRPQEANFPLNLEAEKECILDFAQEINGGAEIELQAPGGTKIELGYGEHLTNGRVAIHVPSDATTYADRFITRSGAQILPTTLQQRGFRYLQITASQPIIIKNVHAVDRRHPLVPPRFHCDDEPFNQLYGMAHHTISSCATDALVDCPWREQSLWINDLVVNASFWLEAGGSPQLVARCLQLALSEANKEGVIYSVTPNGEHEEIVFLATNAALPLIIDDLSQFDQKLAFAFLPQVRKVLLALEQFSDKDGLLVGPKRFWNFVDWSFEFVQPDLFTNRAAASVNGFYLLGLRTMAELEKRAGGDAQRWHNKAEKIAQSFHQRFWNDKKQCYQEVEDGALCSELAQALACLANPDSPLTKVLLTKLAQDDQELLKPELFMMHFVLKALINNGHHQAAKERLRRYWGPMAEANSPTLWEANVHQHGSTAFDGAGSLCHGFSCAPLWALPRLFGEAEVRS